MAETINLDKDGNPTGETTVEPMDAFNQPMRFNAQTTFQSPFFWIVVGAAVAAVGYYLLKKKIG